MRFSRLSSSRFVSAAFLGSSTLCRIFPIFLILLPQLLGAALGFRRDLDCFFPIFLFLSLSPHLLAGRFAEVQFGFGRLIFVPQIDRA